MLVPIEMPVMAPVPVTLLIVFELTLVPLPPKLLVMMVIALLPPAMLLKVLPVIVLVGPLVLDAPSVLLHPAIVVAPVTVTFEKLFPVCVMVEPLTDDALPVKKEIVPPAPPLLKPVTMLLLLQLSEPVAVMLPARVRKITLPVVLTLRLVNVLLLMFAAAEEAFDQVM